MYEWNETIQKMIDWIEAHLTENPTLLQMSEEIGYSPYYVSTKFHEVVGMTVKNYIAGRRLSDESFCECLRVHTGGLPEEAETDTSVQSTGSFLPRTLHE